MAQVRQQHAQSVVHLGARLVRKGIPVDRGCFLHLALSRQTVGKVVVRRNEIRIGLDRSAKLLDGIAQAPLQQTNDSQAVIRRGARRGFDRGAILLGRLVELFLSQQGPGQVEVRLRAARIQLERFTIIRDGLSRVSLLVEDETEIAIDLCFRFQLERPSIVGSRIVEPAQLDQGKGEVVVRFDVVRIDR